MTKMPTLEEAGLQDGRLELLHRAYTACGGRICTDSRLLQAGDCFVALKGEKVDGRDFVGQVLEQGAGLVLVDQGDPTWPEEHSDRVFEVRDSLAALQCLALHHRRSIQGLKVIGIAGSNGKTTCKELIYAVLSQHYICHATPGNYNNHLGVPLSLLGIRPGTAFAVIELGTNHPGEIEILCRMAEPDMGLVTSIGKEHLEGFGDLNQVIREEITLYRWIKEHGGHAFMHRDADLLVQNVALQDVTMTYGTHSSSDCLGKLIHSFPYLSFVWEMGSRALAHAPVVQTRVYGDYNFPHLLAAAALGRFLSVPYSRICAALETWEPRQNRSEIREFKGHWLVLDAYNANPDSMQAALGHFDRMQHPHKVILLGEMLEMGTHSEHEHRFLLENVSGAAFQAVCLIGSAFWNLRQEFPWFHFFKGPEDLQTFLQEQAWPSSAILLKGSRGNAMEQYLAFLPQA